MSDRRRNRLAKLSDDQLRTLYELHVTRGFSAAELARQIRARFGFASVISARKAIKEGWKRLYLIEAEPFHRCEGTKRRPPEKGRRCQRKAMIGQRFCELHGRPERAKQHAAAMRVARGQQP